MNKFIFYKKGISIVETLVAIAIMSILILSVVSLLVNTSNNEKRNRTISEVEFQASSIIYEIAQSVRNAASITSPSVGATSTSLTLVMPFITGQNPTVFSTSSQSILVSRAGGSANKISSDLVLVTSLIFQNISAPSTDGAVRVYLSVKSYNPNSKAELEYSTSRMTTITLR